MSFLTKNWYNLYWALWLLVGFAPLELWALVKNPRATLSETVWRWFDVAPGSTLAQWSFAHFFLLAFMTWLYFHFIFALFR